VGLSGTRGLAGAVGVETCAKTGTEEKSDKADKAKTPIGENRRGMKESGMSTKAV
jgi:hypothetical protein